MPATTPSALPLARHDQLVVVPMADETLVQSLDTHQAHCLPSLTALIWQHCDGQTSVSEITRRVQHATSQPVDEKTVWLAVHELGKAHLLEQRLVRPADRHISRRELLRNSAALAAAVLVTSIAVPHANAAVSSCIGTGGTCTAVGTHDLCCAGLSCAFDGVGNTCKPCGVSGDSCSMGTGCCMGFACVGGTCAPN